MKDEIQNLHKSEQMITALQRSSITGKSKFIISVRPLGPSAGTVYQHNFSVLNIIRSENGSKLETGSNTLTRRKLGDLGKNTKTECVKSSGAYKNFRLSLYAIT